MATHPIALLEQRATANPEDTFIDALDAVMTNAEALHLTRRVATHLRDLGVREGDVVALNLPAPLHIVFALAVWHEAAICCSFAPWLAESATLKPDWLFSTFDYPSNAAQRVINLDGPYLSLLRQPDADLAPRAIHNDMVARLVFSSGTTGLPKAVPLTFQIIEERTRQRLALHPSSTLRFGLQDVGAVDGFIRFAMALRSNQPYLVPGPPAHNVAQIAKHQPSVVAGSPAQLIALLEFLTALHEDEHSIQEFTVIGSQLPAPVALRLRTATGAIITTAYGSTEAGRIAGRRFDSDDGFDVGDLDDNAEVQIVDEEDQLVPLGEVGRLRCRQKGQISGYFRDEETTKLNFRDGWFYPGDLARITSTGRLELAGRSSELFNLGGVKIDPARVDEVALTHEGVTDAATFVSTHESRNDELVLAIVGSDHVSEGSLLELLRSQFGKAAPRTIVRRTAIPRNANGKIGRRLLSEEFDGRSTSSDLN